MQLNQRFSYPKWEKQVTVSCRKLGFVWFLHYIKRNVHLHSEPLSVAQRIPFCMSFSAWLRRICSFGKKKTSPRLDLGFPRLFSRPRTSEPEVLLLMAFESLLVFFVIFNDFLGTSLVVQLLRPCAPNAGAGVRSLAGELELMCHH